MLAVYVANPSASLSRRAVWLLLLLAGAVFTTYQIVDILLSYIHLATNDVA